MSGILKGMYLDRRTTMKKLLLISALLLFSTNGYTREDTFEDAIDLGGSIYIMYETKYRNEYIQMLCIGGKDGKMYIKTKESLVELSGTVSHCSNYKNFYLKKED